jgi:hypothetical protein
MRNNPASNKNNIPRLQPDSKAKMGQEDITAFEFGKCGEDGPSKGRVLAIGVKAREAVK